MRLAGVAGSDMDLNPRASPTHAESFGDGPATAFAMHNPAAMTRLEGHHVSLGAGLVAFLGARLQSGVATVLDAVDLRGKLVGADLVITAEGRVDAQSAFGKAPAGVATLAAELGVPCIVLAGSLGPGFEELYSHGVCSVFSILDRPMDLATALAEAAPLLTQTAEAVMRVWAAQE